MLMRDQTRFVSVLSALLLSNAALAQQEAPQQPQMPQAPKAPAASELDPATSATQTTPQYPPTELGGEIELNLSQADEQDENGDRRRDTAAAELKLTLDFEQEWGRYVQFSTRLALSSVRFSEEELNNDDDEFSYDVERLHLDLEPNKAFQLRLGRQRISDEMQTILDENLDGVRFRYRQKRVEYSLSHTEKDGVELGTRSSQDNIRNTFGSITFDGVKGSSWMPYLLHRTFSAPDSEDGFENTWIGLQGIVEPKKSPLRYWVHASVLDGSRDDDDESTELGGAMVDLGINWRFDVALKPTLSLALTHASGGSAEDRFRQSGLHDNDFALNGYNSFRYRGEVLDPEFTNIQIITLGLGAKLGKDWEADIALHSYEQVEIDDQLRGSDIGYDPLGVNGNLGFGADLIVSFSPVKGLDIKGSTGAFSPGDAFDDEQNLAWVTQLEIGYSF